MTEQLAITLVAASVGFSAAIFFCIGNILNTAKNILRQSVPYWDFSEPVARALAAQRAQYVVGGLFLVVAFFLQLVAALVSATTPANLPQYFDTWLSLVSFTLIPVIAFGALIAFFIYKLTIQKVFRLERQEREEESRKL